ncbi:MAG: thiaminase II [Chloroflexi bacterium]|nr:thiaminase II [Chloroflexota bacterium]
MRSAVAAEWDRAHRDHPTVRGIGDGTLSLERFRYYMSQDYLFLIEYCRVVALATAKSPDLESMGQWAALLNETLNSEMELHRSFCEDFGISRDALEATRPSATTLAYTGFLLQTARDGTIAEIASAMLPCQWGYDQIGEELGRSGIAESGSLHRRWIDGYNAPEYRALTTWLRELTDGLAETASDDRREEMRQLFAEGVRHEHAFWQAAWDMQEPLS